MDKSSQPLPVPRSTLPLTLNTSSRIRRVDVDYTTRSPHFGDHDNQRLSPEHWDTLLNRPHAILLPSHLGAHKFCRSVLFILWPFFRTKFWCLIECRMTIAYILIKITPIHRIYASYICFGSPWVAKCPSLRARDYAAKTSSDNNSLRLPGFWTKPFYWNFLLEKISSWTHPLQILSP